MTEYETELSELLALEKQTTAKRKKLELLDEVAEKAYTDFACDANKYMGAPGMPSWYSLHTNYKDEWRRKTGVKS